MSFSWGDYHKLAIELINSKKQNFIESRKRSAVSRAYYAAYNIVVNFANEFYEDFELDKLRSHKYVADWFTVNEPKVGVQLENLFEFRKLCDYENDVKNLETIVKSSITISKKIIYEIDRQRTIFLITK